MWVSTQSLSDSARTQTIPQNPHKENSVIMDQWEKINKVFGLSFDRVLSPEEETAVRNYLNARWAIF